MKVFFFVPFLGRLVLGGPVFLEEIDLDVRAANSYPSCISPVLKALDSVLTIMGVRKRKASVHLCSMQAR
jgi:hypothetical protein